MIEKKVGACLEIKNNNYGSMLQSFATQKILENMNIEYDLLNYRKKYTLILILKSIPRLLNHVVWQDKFNEKQKQFFLKRHPECKDEYNKRKIAFENFRKQYFKAKIVTFFGYNELKLKSKKYSCFVTGSDQLWSPSGLPTNFYNLMFAKDDAIKISFASSFGVKNIPWYQKRRTKQYLNRINFISCREESGCKIVKNLTNKDAVLVADPTMMFTGEEWNNIFPSTIKKPAKYIFSYFLGTSFEYRKQVLLLKEKTGLPIVTIHQYIDADLNFGDEIIEGAGPIEFIDLIRNAEYVCTDSFHGSVFSILNHKKFIVFNRYSEKNAASKNTRIKSLCKRLDLEDRIYTGNINNIISKDIDYDKVDKKLDDIRKITNSYLNDAFKSIRR